MEKLSWERSCRGPRRSRGLVPTFSSQVGVVISQYRMNSAFEPVCSRSDDSFCERLNQCQFSDEAVSHWEARLESPSAIPFSDTLIAVP